MSGLYGTPIIAPAAINTIQIENSDGSTILGVVTGEETIFTATDNDVREGSVYASDGGVSTGTKVIPSYHTTEILRYIPVGSDVTIPLPTLNKYDYTKLQVIICDFNENMSNSVSATKISILDKVFDVNSTNIVSNVTKDETTKSINLGITNNSTVPWVVRCLTYKEID